MDEHFETPILLLIFNRPDLTKIVFERIRQIKPRNLFVAADGPRSHLHDEIQLCQQTRAVTEKIDWECNVKTLYREINLGCGQAVNGAINWFFSHVEYGIIFEDDCLPSISFFLYCEELLIKYRSEKKIFLIGGNNFQNGIARGEASYYFSNYGHIWGWATWKRAWQMHNPEIFNFDPKTSLKKFENLFNSKSEIKYWKIILNKCLTEEIDEWDYKWIYTIWRNHGITISPNTNLVINLGLKGNGNHYFLYDSFKSELKCNEIKFPLVHPQNLIIDKEADIFTFENIYSHSLKRIIRLYKENSLKSIAQYYSKRYFPKRKKLKLL